MSLTVKDDGSGRYDPCPDADRNGNVGLSDFYIFEARWDQAVPGDCVGGDPCGVY